MAGFYRISEMRLFLASTLYYILESSTRHHVCTDNDEQEYCDRNKNVNSHIIDHVSIPQKLIDLSSYILVD